MPNDVARLEQGEKSNAVLVLQRTVRAWSTRRNLREGLNSPEIAAVKIQRLCRRYLSGQAFQRRRGAAVILQKCIVKLLTRLASDGKEMPEVAAIAIQVGGSMKERRWGEQLHGDQ